jgi:hypothetical protein
MSFQENAGSADVGDGAARLTPTVLLTAPGCVSVGPSTVDVASLAFADSFAIAVEPEGVASPSFVDASRSSGSSRFSPGSNVSNASVTLGFAG